MPLTAAQEQNVAKIRAFHAKGRAERLARAGAALLKKVPKTWQRPADANWRHLPTFTWRLLSAEINAIPPVPDVACRGGASPLAGAADGIALVRFDPGRTAGFSVHAAEVLCFFPSSTAAKAYVSEHGDRLRRVTRPKARGVVALAWFHGTDGGKSESC